MSHITTAVAMRSVASVCVCLFVYPVRESWPRYFIFWYEVHPQNIYVKFVYRDNRVEVKVTGAKRDI